MAAGGGISARCPPSDNLLLLPLLLLQEADTLYELAEEQQQRGASAAAAFGGSTWGQEAVASCIYESIPGPCCTPELRTGYEAYQARRGRWPLRPAVWRILFQSQLSRVVCALLGHAAHLFNDQVRAERAQAAVGAAPDQWSPSCAATQ